MTWSTILPQSQNVDISTDYAAVLLPDGVIVYIGGRAAAGVARTKRGGQASSTHYNNIYILDVENYAWATTITSTSTAGRTTATNLPTTIIIVETQPNKDKLYIAIAIGAGGVILVGIAFIAGFLIYKKKLLK
ncbi:hypothetical protein F8M41_000801 [Gigaspora margarita]|uniref:Uncharacterized protein n=1 Tax=Gigaspora margarita TaxID=4874 RepID=A0A8H3XIG5_GIGMA|nr:hypothetical protein F8M41_000801 [Gigaspora margarita]